MDGYVTRSQFAVIYGCSKPYVTKLVADKRVVLSTDGKLINVEASMRLLDVTSDPSKAGVRDRWAAYRAGQMPAATNTPRAPIGGLASAAGAAAAAPASSSQAHGSAGAATSSQQISRRSGDVAGATQQPQPDATRQPPDESAYHQARTKREQAEAELATLELKKALGQLLDAPSTLRAFVDVQMTARNELLALADRLAPLVTPETDTRKVYDMIQAEAERVCETIGNKLAALSVASIVLA